MSCKNCTNPKMETGKTKNYSVSLGYYPKEKDGTYIRSIKFPSESRDFQLTLHGDHYISITHCPWCGDELI